MMETEETKIMIDPRVLGGLSARFEADRPEAVSDDDLTAYAMGLLEGDENARVKEALRSSEATDRRMEAVRSQLDWLASPEGRDTVERSRQRAAEIIGAYRAPVRPPKGLLSLLKPKPAPFPSGRLSISVHSPQDNGFRFVFDALNRSLGASVAQDWATAGGLQARGGQTPQYRPVLSVDIDDPAALDLLAAALYDCLGRGISFTIELSEDPSTVAVVEIDGKDKAGKKPAQRSARTPLSGIDIAERDDKEQIGKKILSRLKKR